MGNIDKIGDYSEKYRAYGQKILNESAVILQNAGIRIPLGAESPEEATDSCVIKQSTQTTQETVKPNDNENKVIKKKNDVSWIRDAMPTSDNPLSISSSISGDCATSLGKAAMLKNNSPTENSDTGSEDTEEIDSYELQQKETDANKIEDLSNASDDEGNGNPLNTLIEKKGFANGYNSKNFAGIHNEIDKQNHTFAQKATIYSDNLWSKNETTIIFGGIANYTFNKSQEESTKNFNYNVYAFGKQKFKNYTFGLGAICSQNDDVRKISISAAAMENNTKLRLGFQKDITKIPGLPAQNNTHMDIGIGDESGYLDENKYNRREKTDIEETLENDKIGDLDPLPKGEDIEIDTNNSEKPQNTVIKLIISDTSEKKEYGINAGYIFRKVTQKRNYAFIMPYGTISNLNVDSNEGIKMALGVNTGNHVDCDNGWNYTTKGMLEVMREAINGSRPSDNLLANINFKAAKKKFSGELSFGTYLNSNNTDCKYAEAKVYYQANENLKIGLKAAAADYKFDNDRQNIYAITAGVNYTL